METITGRANNNRIRARIIVDIYGETKSEEQISNNLVERFVDIEYVRSFLDLVRRSILDQLIRGHLLSLKL